MYIIEFEKGVYSAKGSGDPARTLKVENARSFSDETEALKALAAIIEDIKHWRKFPNARIKWRDEVSMILSN